MLEILIFNKEIDMKPYETSTGKLFNSDKVAKDVLAYITSEHITDELGYDYKDSGYNFVFITGKNELEKELPVFDFPLFFKNIRNVPTIAIDIRPYVVNAKQPFTSLKEILRDRNAVNFLILTAYLSIKFEEDELALRPILHHILIAFSTLIVNAINRITQLPLPDKVGVEIASSIYAYAMFYPENDLKDETDKLTALLSKSKLTFPIDKRLLKDQIEQIVSGVTEPVTGLKLLSNLLNTSVPEDMRAIVNIEAICKVFDNSWYGPGSTRAVYISLESLPTFMAMVYACGASNMYKSSKIAIALDANKRAIDLPAVVSYINNTLVKRDLESLF